MRIGRLPQYCFRYPPTIMRILLISLLLGSLSVHVSVARKFKRCEFLENLESKHSIGRLEAVIWTCLAERLTSIDTNKTVGMDEKYYGLFQVNEKYWCSKGASGCGIECSQLLDDDISDDLKCAQLIFNETKKISENGFSAWPTYEGCRGEEETFLKSCNLELNSIDGNVDILKGGVLEDAPPEVKPFTPNTEPDYKVFDQCDLARELYMTHGLSMDMVANLVCIANHESHFNSSAIGRRNEDGSLDYGMFQISDNFWCSKEELEIKGCNMQCQNLLDNDITDDVRCVKKVYEETSKFSSTGFDAWAVYTRNGSDCRNESKSYIAGCFEESVMLNPAPMPPTQKAYEICELYEELKGKVLDEDISKFICIAYYESHLITSSTRQQGAHGLFQIKEDRWCKKRDDKADTLKGCPVYCDQLRDINIQDDIECAKNVKNFLGFEAWPAYNQFCTDRADVFTYACKAQSPSNAVDDSPVVDTEPIYPKNPWLKSIKPGAPLLKLGSPVMQPQNNPSVNSDAPFTQRQSNLPETQYDPYRPGSIALNSIEEVPHSLSLPYYILSFTDPFQRLKATFEIEKSVLEDASIKIKPVKPSLTKKGGFDLVIEKDKQTTNLLTDMNSS